MYTNEGERNGSRDTNIFILVTSILLQKLFPRRDKRGGGRETGWNSTGVASHEILKI